jgi:peroxiredoxin
LDTKDVRGAVLFFFASWRGDQDSNLLDMQKVFEDYGKDGIKVFLISIDFKQDTYFQMIRSKVDELKITCPVLWDHESVAKQLNGVELIPAALLIDKEGKIRYEEQAIKSQLNLLNTIPIDSSMLRNAIDYLIDA